MSGSAQGAPGYGDEGGLGLVAPRPRACRVIRALALLTRVLDRQKHLAVGGEGEAGQLGPHRGAGELEDVPACDPAVDTGRHHERAGVLEGAPALLLAT